jgi:hypothetical protein
MHKVRLAERLIGFLLVAPFVLIAASYRALPSEISVIRLFLGHAVLVGSKSPFLIFRVPLMNLIHGLMAALMLAYAPKFQDSTRRLGYRNVFATLLLTIGFKSTFEALEISAVAFPRTAPSLEHWLALGAFASVIAGLSMAAWQSRKAPLPWPELQMRLRDKILLLALFGLYLFIVAVSVSISHRVATAVVAHPTTPQQLKRVVPIQVRALVHPTTSKLAQRRKRPGPWPVQSLISQSQWDQASSGHQQASESQSCT